MQEETNKQRSLQVLALRCSRWFYRQYKPVYWYLALTLFYPLYGGLVWDASLSVLHSLQRGCLVSWRRRALLWTRRCSANSRESAEDEEEMNWRHAGRTSAYLWVSWVSFTTLAIFPTNRRPYNRFKSEVVHVFYVLNGLCGWILEQWYNSAG